MANRPHLTLDNFDTESNVPPDCPFVLTSPRSLEACRRLGVQPVDLLPTPLFEYQAQLPDLPRDQVLSIFREAEEDRELSLAICRRLRNQLILEETQDVDQGLLGRWSKRESCCLSPIVEVGGRDSALGTSQTLSNKECASDAPSPVPLLHRPSSLPSLSGEQISDSRLSLSPELYTSTDRPEADQDLSVEDHQLQNIEDLEFGSQDIELDRQQSEILEPANQEIEIYDQELLSEDSQLENLKLESEEEESKEEIPNSENDKTSLLSYIPIENLYRGSYLSFSDGDLNQYTEANHRPEFQTRQTPEGNSTPEGFNSPEGRQTPDLRSEFNFPQERKTPDYSTGLLAIAPQEGKNIPDFRYQVYTPDCGDSSECRSTPSPSLVLRKTNNYQDLSSHLSDQDTSRLHLFGRRGEDRVGRCYSESSDNSEDPDNLFLLRPAVTFSLRNQQGMRNQGMDNKGGPLVEGETTASNTNSMSRNIKVYQNPCGPPLLTTTPSPYAKTCAKSTSSKKKKAKRKTRLTSDSVTSLNLDNEEHKNTNVLEDDVPEAERSHNLTRSSMSGSKTRPSTAPNQSAKSPWNKSSPTLVLAADSEILRAVLSGCRSEVDLRRIRVTEQDCRLLELMALKKRQQCLQEMKADRLHAKWQNEREKRENNKVLTNREWRRNLEAKRKREAEDNLRRLQEARNNFLNSQELLRKLLKEKDERTKMLLQNISKKRVLLKFQGETKRENRELDDQRSVAVVKAVEDLLSRDTQYRRALQTDLERKQETAEKRRKQREEEEKKRIINNNRSEEEQHKERMKRIEERYSQQIHQIKSGIESKQERSRKAASEKRDERIRHMSSHRLLTAVKQEQTFALKSELETGLDKWRHQVLEVQSMSIRRAEEKARRELERRREKVAEEIKTREVRHQEIRGKCEKEVRDQQAWHRRAIWQKQKKVERMLDDRERAVERARKMAFKTAELRDVIRNQSCSDLRIPARGGSLSKNVTLSKNSSHLQLALANKS